MSDRDAFEDIHYIESLLKLVYHCSFFRNLFLSADGIVAGISGFLIVLCYYWFTGTVAGLGFPSFVADNGCVSSPPNMMTHMTLD